MSISRSVTAACTDTSSADTGSSATTTLAPPAKAACDAHALLLPARQLPRHPFGELARQLHEVKEFQHPRLALGVGIAFVEDLERADDLAPHRHAGFSVSKGFWNTICTDDTVPVLRFSMGVSWMS